MSLAQVVGTYTCRLLYTVSHINPGSGGYVSLKKLKSIYYMLRKTHPVNIGAESIGKIDYFDGLPFLNSYLVDALALPHHKQCYSNVNDNGTLTGE